MIHQCEYFCTNFCNKLCKKLNLTYKCTLFLKPNSIQQLHTILKVLEGNKKLLYIQTLISAGHTHTYNP